jgi:hypothetical protein
VRGRRGTREAAGETLPPIPDSSRKEEQQQEEEEAEEQQQEEEEEEVLPTTPHPDRAGP